jgi:hypothetical protein
MYKHFDKLFGVLMSEIYLNFLIYPMSVLGVMYFNIFNINVPIGCAWIHGYLLLDRNSGHNHYPD